MKIIAGAYPAAPPAHPWSKEAEQAFLATLVDSPESTAIGGLELPWQDGALHGQDEPWFLSHLPRDWRHVVTMIPDTMITGRSDDTFGLASSDEPGRRRAIEHARVLRDHLDTLCQHEGRSFAAAVEIHSAPTHRRPDGAAGSSGAAYVGHWTSWRHGTGTERVSSSSIATPRPRTALPPKASSPWPTNWPRSATCPMTGRLASGSGSIGVAR